MKKKRLLIWLAAASMLVCGFAFASCKTPESSKTEPTETGNYWHYVDGVPTKWE